MNPAENEKAVVEISNQEFESEVLESPMPVLVDFWARWCGPCRMLAPVLEEIGEAGAGRFKVVKVNVDQEPAIAAKYGIRALPTLLIFKDGTIREKIVGLVSKATLVNKLGAATGIAIET